MPFRNDPRFRETGFFTSTGKALLLDDPRPEHIDLRDIAMSLARQCRFGSNLRSRFVMYSVAQHSVLVSRRCPNEKVGGLLHDGSEFPLGDTIRPKIRLLPSEELKKLHIKWMKAIGEAFDVQLIYNMKIHPEVKEADNRMLATEIRDLYYNIEHEVDGYEPYQHMCIYPWDIEQAYSTFLIEAQHLGIYDGMVAWPRDL